MWVNILVKESTKKYIILTDEELGDGDTYILDYLIEDGYEEFCNIFHSYQKATSYMKEFYDDFKPLKFEAVPITFKQASNFVNKYHRHHVAPQGYKFGVAVTDGDIIVGVAIAGRPVSRIRDDQKTIEVRRLCVKHGYKNVCSILYSKVNRIAKEMGYEKVITYTLEQEIGTSLIATGFECIGINKGGSWSSKRRPRKDKAPTEPKKIWQICLVS